MVLNIHANCKAYEGQGEGGGRGLEVVEEGILLLYTYRYTVTTRMTCIKMGSERAILMFY